MKNRVFKKTDDFRQFKAKIFFCTIWMVTIAVGCIYLLYSLFLKGRFADLIVSVNQKLFGLDYDAARTLYQWTFRNHIELVFVVGMVLVFFITFSRISLVRLLEMLLYEFQPMLHEKNLECNLMVPEDIMIRCDADKIQRVFDNLLKNAVIYSFEGTDINIAVVGQGEDVEITFTNHGDTIPEEKLERIFEQFYRLDASRSTGSGGAGLGLAIAKQIIELHHGAIMAGSENEMIEFKVILPVS